MQIDNRILLSEATENEYRQPVLKWTQDGPNMTNDH